MFGPPHTHIHDALRAIDVRGKRVLDIGCWEGHWSFEIERRGAAEVYATDYLVGDPRATVDGEGRPELPTFRLAHSILGSKVKYHPTTSVYHIDELGVTDFDVILFCGVYYHLKHPLVAFSKLRRLLKRDATIVVEGPVILGPTEASARFYYRELLGDDATNWWVPTVPCLRQWIECSFLEIVGEHGPAYSHDREKKLFGDDQRDARTDPRTETIARYAMVARAVNRLDPKYALPDEDLEQFASSNG